MTARTAIALGAVLVCGSARADPFPARMGTSGLLDLPEARWLGLGSVALGLELRLDAAPGKPRAVGPSPVTMVFGLGYKVEIGLALREGGLPGDPRPSPLLFGAALKVGLFEGKGPVPSFALQGTVDRINILAKGALELIVSTEIAERVRLLAVGGLEDQRGLGLKALGPRGGGAIAVRGPNGSELVLEALGRQGGPQIGGALRWAFQKETGIALGVQWQPGDQGLRVSLGFAFSSSPPPRFKAYADEEVVAPVVRVVEVAKPGARVFHDSFPHLRLKIKAERMAGDDANRHLQYWPQRDGSSQVPAPAKAPATKPKSKPETKLEAKPAKPVPAAVQAKALEKLAVPAKAQEVPAPAPASRPTAVKSSAASQPWASLETSVGAALQKAIRGCAWSVKEDQAKSRVELLIIIAPIGAAPRAALAEGWRPGLQPFRACVQKAIAGLSFPATSAIYSIWVDLPAVERR